MDKRDRRALVSFMTIILHKLYPLLDEYPLKEIGQIDETEGDESDKLNDMPHYAVEAYYLKKAIDTIAYEGNK